MTDAGASSSKPNARKADSGTGNGTGKRRKVNHACLYCRRSHMHCDENRPCARCIKRDIGHLCHDETKPPAPAKQGTTTTQSSDSPAEATPAPPQPQPTLPVSVQQPWPASVSTANSSFAPLSAGGLPGMKVDSVGMYGSGAGSTPFVAAGASTSPLVGLNNTWPLIANDPSTFFSGDSATGAGGGEISVLSQFLDNLDANPWFNAPHLTSPEGGLLPSSALQQSQGTPSGTGDVSASPLFGFNPDTPQSQPTPRASAAGPSASPELVRHEMPPVHQHQQQPHHELEHVDPLPPSTKTERFLLTAADQETGTRDERLKAVIRAKYEAALLKPYNYVKGYARLSRWMERNVSPESRQAIMQPISVLRPKFRGIAQNLKDIDLVYVEEAFERLLLDYDRVFSAMGIPACLWRRTGEIYKANKSFADLVGIDVNKMRDGRLCIYELMSESSAVNYWEKYGHVAFDTKQKAVLTSCVLRYKPNLTALQPNGGASASAFSSRRKSSSSSEGRTDSEELTINCCFSFTIRRDIWGIPSMIVGNFIKC